MQTINSKEEFLKSIEDSNEIFNKLSKAEKRVEIAKDVIARIKLKMIDAENGITVEIENFEDNNLINKEIINSNTCQVCAKGALFTAFVGRVNNFNKFFHELTDNRAKDSLHKKLNKLFSWKQLALIEVAFEGHQLLNYDDKGSLIILSEKVEDRATANYAYEFDNNDELLIKICENIIENNGTFKP